MTEKDHVVVTGGAGFLGSHLVDSLLTDSYRVTVLDNYGSGRRKNLEHRNEEYLEVVSHDVCQPFPPFKKVDIIYHLASRASPKDFESHAVDIALTNSEGTRNALDCAREHDATVVLASTSEVYGDPEVNPQTETYNGNVNVRGPRAPYDEGKRFTEALGVAYETQYDVDVRTARIFNTYGPRMRKDDGRVIPTFVGQALRGEDLTVYGDGDQTRSFCFVYDMISGLRRLAGAESEDVSGEAFNLGSTTEITIQQLAEDVLSIVDTGSGIVYEPLPPDDPQVRRPDVSKAEEVLGWRPEVKLKNGIERTVESFRE